MNAGAFLESPNEVRRKRRGTNAVAVSEQVLAKVETLRGQRAGQSPAQGAIILVDFVEMLGVGTKVAA